MENQNCHNLRDSQAVAVAAAEKDLESLPIPLEPPPSLASSPSHEFSFTISFNTPNSLSTSSAAGAAVETRKLFPPPPIGFDFAPADDIYGHLLPLHFVSRIDPSDVSVQNAAFLCVDHNETDENTNADATTAVTAAIEEDCKDRRNRKYFSFCWLKNFVRGSGGEEKQRRIRRRKRAFDGLLRVWKKCASLPESFLC